MTFDSTIAAAPESERLTAALKAFDRKERPFLIQTCLGIASKQLDRAFLDTVSDALGIAPRLSSSSWWTTDFHFDWLAGALALFYEPNLATKTTSFDNKVCDDVRLVAGSQEDADLLIVDGIRLVMLEAKRYGSWQQEQVTRKYRRAELLRAFADGLAERLNRPKIAIHLMFSSPPSRGRTGSPPALRRIWQGLGCQGEPPWIPLQGADETPATQALLTSRCGSDENTKPSPSKDGTRWFIDTVQLP